MKYFSYGMNTNLDQMSRRCAGAVCLGAAWINNYQFEFRKSLAPAVTVCCGTLIKLM